MGNDLHEVRAPFVRGVHVVQSATVSGSTTTVLARKVGNRIEVTATTEVQDGGVRVEVKLSLDRATCESFVSVLDVEDDRP